MARTWEQVAAIVDGAAPRVLDELAAIQAAYRAAHGRFFQGVWTGDAPPADGTDQTMDRNRRPHDQDETWADVGVTRRRLPVRVAVDVTPDTYILRVEVRWNGVSKVKAWAVGPETGLSHDWLDCPEEP